MSRTRRKKDKFSEVLRSVSHYKRLQRQQLLKEFELEYMLQNNSSSIEL